MRGEQPTRRGQKALEGSGPTVAATLQLAQWRRQGQKSACQEHDGAGRALVRSENEQRGNSRPRHLLMLANVQRFGHRDLEEERRG